MRISSIVPSAPILFLLLVAATGWAGIPQMISYQGKVTDTSGNPVADGSYIMRFRVYDDAKSGTESWDSGNQTVDVTGGVFSVLLGESPQPPLTSDFTADYWLAVTFDGVDQYPRQRFTSVGYAYMASGLVPGAQVVGSVTSGSRATITVVNTATEPGAFGIRGSVKSAGGCGVHGRSLFSTAGAGFGVHGEAWGGIAVWGECQAVPESGSGYGILGSANGDSSTGVAGFVHGGPNGTPDGVHGLNIGSGGNGVFGMATARLGLTCGVRGQSASKAGKGVHGIATAPSGVTYGVYGSAMSSSGFGVYSEGNLAASGSKSCVVRTSQGPRLMYCQESPETWFEDFGEGRLTNGRCHIELDPLFQEAVTIDTDNPMKVFVELEDEDCMGIVVRRGRTGFDVIERHGGKSSSPFWYRVVAKRKGFESSRLEYCAGAEQDSYLYPEMRELRWRKLEEDHARCLRENGRLQDVIRRMKSEAEPELIE